jgi:hypothetical protein
MDHGNLEFFDSYGLTPDEELNFNKNEYFRKSKNQDYPHLSYLLDHSPYEISYNNYKFQQKRNDIRTCGRHVACRIIFRHMPLEDYKVFMTDKYLTPDQIVTLLSAKI